MYGFLSGLLQAVLPEDPDDENKQATRSNDPHQQHQQHQPHQQQHDRGIKRSHAHITRAPHTERAARNNRHGHHTTVPTTPSSPPQHPTGPRKRVRIEAMPDVIPSTFSTDRSTLNVTTSLEQDTSTSPDVSVLERPATEAFDRELQSFITRRRHRERLPAADDDALQLTLPSIPAMTTSRSAAATASTVDMTTDMESVIDPAVLLHDIDTALQLCKHLRRLRTERHQPQTSATDTGQRQQTRVHFLQRYFPTDARRVAGIQGTFAALAEADEQRATAAAEDPERNDDDSDSDWLIQDP